MAATRKPFVDAYVEGIWNVYDADQSGYLEKEEARTFTLGLLEALAEEGEVHTDVDFDAGFAAFDDDKNGRLSKTEVHRFVEMLMSDSHAAVDTNDASSAADTKTYLDNYMSEVYTTYDGDRSGYLERGEARTFVDTLIVDMTASGLDIQGFDFDACFDMYDQDGNGRLSRKELRVFVGQLMGVDE
ncbi:Aste57867_5816 [Aphanomyces stellatus]|uniref:Aste57867_5816 protein n=1 Tax=Aphanomyces stellatus TaxID=120398 RepID=A0A485KDE4_9STRA|nr:hypothetical protein As57867_005802 [Aphanomyces stellatus]VFT82839.1 Aste57867_5816 [Aphanomyces stellatus]